jgi:uncharacterized membrane protein
MEKRGKASKIHCLIFVILFLFILIQVASPFSQPKNSIRDLSGVTILIDNENQWSQMSHPWQDMYRLGDFVCHTKATRSYFLNGNQLPFCARCTAIWIGLSIGLGIMIFFKNKNQILFLTGFILSIGLLGFDGFGQLLKLWESTNELRLITGLTVGVFTGIAVGIIIDEIKELKKEKERKKL